ncbi:MAG TPA: DMT family transporter [Thermoplasmata archaeon]|nr:DMT family transporter [Thermoplasmata archaeon]
MPPRDRRNAVLLTTFASLIWGTSFPGVKWGLGYAGNDIVFLWLRFIVASVATLAIVLLLKKFSFRVLKDPVIWLVGAFNAGSFIAQYVGLTLTTASKTALLVDINVIAVAIVSYFAFRERLNRIQSVGILVGIAGIILLTADGGMSFGEDEFLGDMIVYLSGWGWAFFIVLNKKLLSRYSAIEVSTAAIATSTIWLALPVAYLGFTGADFTIEPKAWAAIIYLGIACTSVATLLWAMGLEGVSATASATIMLLEIVTALVISILLLDESLKQLALIGAALVLAAIYLVASSGHKGDAPAVSHT